MTPDFEKMVAEIELETTFGGTIIERQGWKIARHAYFRGLEDAAKRCEVAALVAQANKDAAPSDKQAFHLVASTCATAIRALAEEVK